MTEYEQGDRVVLADTHHAHNSGLKALEGTRGSVVRTPTDHNEKCLVEFDGQTAKLTDRWWVKPMWLETVEDP